MRIPNQWKLREMILPKINSKRIFFLLCCRCSGISAILCYGVLFVRPNRFIAYFSWLFCFSILRAALCPWRGSKTKTAKKNATHRNPSKRWIRSIGSLDLWLLAGTKYLRFLFGNWNVEKKNIVGCAPKIAATTTNCWIVLICRSCNYVHMASPHR